MQYWLMKSEPRCFSISDLKKSSGRIEPWDGVRNYQARNFMRTMVVGDQAFFYHSNITVPGIVGIMEIVREAYPDPTQFTPDNMHYDPKSSIEKPRWDLVDVKFVREFKQIISLNTLKSYPGLEKMLLLQKGNRLSVMPISAQEWHIILDLAG